MSARPYPLVLLVPFLILALPVFGLGTPELDPLSADVETFTRSTSPSAEESRRLMHRIHLAEATYDTPALTERKEAGKQQLQALREKMAAAGSLASATLRTPSLSTPEQGTLRGRVLDHLAVPVLWAYVEIYSLEGFYVANAITDPEGRYSLDLPPASYYVYVNPIGSGLSPQIHLGIHCPIFSCGFEDATPVHVISGNTLTLDFQLIALGAIEGRVLRYEDGTPITSGNIAVFTRYGLQLGITSIQNGHYRFGGLYTGTYYVATSNLSDRVGLIYRDVTCPNKPFDYQLRCSLDQATPIEVVTGATTRGIDLLPRKAATVEGRVVAQNDSTPLAGVSVNAFDSLAGWVAGTSTDANGNYRLEGLSPGRSYVAAEGLGLTPQVYRFVDCAFSTSCLSSGQPLILELGEVRTGIDFELKNTGTLTGQVFDETTGAPIGGAAVEIGPVGSTYLWGIVTTDSAGYYSFSNLPAVSYFVKASTPGHIDEYFDNVDARRGADAATPIQIEPGRIRSGVDFRLQKTGIIAATVLSADTGQPLPGCSARAIPLGNQGGSASLASCNPDGQLLVENLDSGFYYLQVEGPSAETVPFLYGSGSCNVVSEFGLCDLAPGRLIEVKSDQTSGVFDIRLERSGQIFLQVHLNGSNWPTGKVTLHQDLSELYSQSLYTSGQTLYFQRLRPGRYRLVAEGTPNWQSVAWPNQPCNRWYCDPRDAGVIEVRAGETAQLAMTLQPLYGYNGCFTTSENLCLNQGRFKIRAFWKDFQGNSGIGIASTLTDETGYFYFFSPSNVEVMIKMLNGCSDRLGHRFWAFAAGLTNVEVQLEVTDTLTGNVELYANGLGQTFQPILDIDAFATCDVDENTSALATAGEVKTSLLGEDRDPTPEPVETAAAPLSDLCQNVGTGICLGGKFKVTATWRTPSGQSGTAFGFRITNDTAGLSFFSSSNIELVVKILDACQTQLPGYWVFASGLTDVEVDLRIENLENGQVKLYHQNPGPFAPILDLGSFTCN